MLKLVEIAKAWIAAANPTSEQKETAQHRASICEECPHKDHNKMFDVYLCSLCGCPISKKIFSPAGPQTCPDNRWKK